MTLNVQDISTLRLTKHLETTFLLTSASVQQSFTGEEAWNLSTRLLVSYASLTRVISFFSCLFDLIFLLHCVLCFFVMMNAVDCDGKTLVKVLVID